MVILKQPDEIVKARASNRIVAEVLSVLREKVRPGVTSQELDKIAEAVAEKRGAKPAFKGYRGYPYSLCASVNEEVVHG
ncbi:M24 family metallopeptidase, partial [bacterium]|nr:M24 family metallopeptidase [bacterium]